MRRKNLCCIGDEIENCDDSNVINDNNDTNVINDNNDTNDLSPLKLICIAGRRQYRNHRSLDEDAAVAFLLDRLAGVERVGYIDLDLLLFGPDKVLIPIEIGVHQTEVPDTFAVLGGVVDVDAEVQLLARLHAEVVAAAVVVAVRHRLGDMSIGVVVVVGVVAGEEILRGLLRDGGISSRGIVPAGIEIDVLGELVLQQDVEDVTAVVLVGIALAVVDGPVGKTAVGLGPGVREGAGGSTNVTGGTQLQTIATAIALCDFVLPTLATARERGTVDVLQDVFHVLVVALHGQFPALPAVARQTHGELVGNHRDMLLGDRYPEVGRHVDLRRSEL